MPEQIKREVAHKVRINDVIKGDYVKREGWNPNFILINSKQVSRVNIMGVVVSVPEDGASYKSITLDDGSGRIEARSFDNPKLFDNVAIGDIVLIIGRPREYNSAKYLIAEIIRKIENKKWMEVRKLELKSEPEVVASVPESPTETPDKGSSPSESSSHSEPPIPPELSKSESIYNTIKKLDSGEGAPTNEVINQSKNPDTEKMIESLLKDGEIFEPSPGRLKVLE